SASQQHLPKAGHRLAAGPRSRAGPDGLKTTTPGWRCPGKPGEDPAAGAPGGSAVAAGINPALPPLGRPPAASRPPRRARDAPVRAAGVKADRAWAEVAGVAQSRVDAASREVDLQSSALAAARSMRIPAVAVAAGSWAALFGTASVLRHASFHTHRFDLGN